MQRDLFNQEVYDVIDRLVADIGIGAEIPVERFDDYLIDGKLMLAPHMRSKDTAERAWRTYQRNQARKRLNRLAKESIQPFQVSVVRIGETYKLEALDLNAALLPSRRHTRIRQQIDLGEAEVNKLLQREDIDPKVHKLLEDHKNSLDMLKEVQEGIKRHRAKHEEREREIIREMERRAARFTVFRGRA